ncbi:uncharacterized protein LOC121641997 [Melanotaenia boesemani]|uniref:uncharacterized protein LOC121639281 n=1 Tax=Melanotaenia boesemani TaxID=1250792 RepID=UPI001C059E32|nr:uncharacterized protein LOC121639281 [Melanotaenia boesemani]XP_041844378.1 uncharacterized protein LOC121641997 [Melanotaenia boesemani]
MPKRKLVTSDTTERDWLRKNVPTRTLTRWKKRKINRALTDIGKHTTQHGSDVDDGKREELRAETLRVPQESEDTTQRDEQIADSRTVPWESVEDNSQIEQRAQPFRVPQDYIEVATQRQEQRTEPFTVVQENFPQEGGDVHSSHGLTEEQSIISILSFALRHNTTGVLLEDLLKLLKLHSGGTTAVPTSKYFLEKPLADITEQFGRHHYCRVCTKYIGSSQSLEETLKCVSCSLFTTAKASLEEGSFFISIPLKDQLKDILENHGMHDLCFCADASGRHVINDMCDGSLYQTIKANSEEDFLSLTFNCDGVPVFQSSRFSIWPILCCVNEIPPENTWQLYG